MAPTLFLLPLMASAKVSVDMVHQSTSAVAISNGPSVVVLHVVSADLVVVAVVAFVVFAAAFSPHVLTPMVSDIVKRSKQKREKKSRS